MRRVISVYLPTWPTDRLRRRSTAWPPDQPLIVAAQAGGRRVVVAPDAKASELGVWRGMPLAQAQATVARLAVVEADPDADAAALAKLAQHMVQRFTPWATVCGDDGLWIEATGSTHLHGGEERMLARIVATIESAGIAVRAATADTPGAAHAIARYSPSVRTVVPVDKHADEMADYPVAALRLAQDVVDGLNRLGLKTIGQLYGKPRAPLARRFNQLFMRLDQALGHIPEPIHYPIPQTVPRSSVRLAEPVGTAEALAHIIARLTDDLCIELEARRLGCRRLDLRFGRVDGDVQAITAKTAKASRSPAHLAKLLGMLIETVDPGFGIEAAILTATVIEPLAPQQLASAAGGEAPEPDLAELVDRLSNRLGDRIYKVALVESDVPERSVKRAPVFSPCGKTWPYAYARPTLLLTPPEPIEVTSLMPDHPPRQFRWRGKLHRVARADGPEVVLGEWWRSEAEVGAVRDYFFVETADGCGYWVFRRRDELAPAGTPVRWYMHGLFA